MTIFAILPLSSCVKALGVFELRRSGLFGDPDNAENCGDSQSLNLPPYHIEPYFDIACFTFHVEIVIVFILNENAATEVVESGLFIAF